MYALFHEGTDGGEGDVMRGDDAEVDQQLDVIGRSARPQLAIVEGCGVILDQLLEGKLSIDVAGRTGNGNGLADDGVDGIAHDLPFGSSARLRIPL